MINRLIFIISFTALNLATYSQESKFLSDRKSEIKNEIGRLRALLNQQKEIKNSELKQLEILNILLKKQDSLIIRSSENLRIYKVEIKDINDSIIYSIDLLNVKIQEKQGEIDKLKESYSSLIYQSYLLQKLYSKTSFFLSVKSLNELYKRNNYLEKLKSYRYQQINQIKLKRVDLMIYKKDAQLYTDSIKFNLNKLQADSITLNSEHRDLETLKEKQELIIENIQRKEQTYLNQIKQKNKETKKIEEAIKRTIEEDKKKEKEKEQMKINKNLNSSIEIKENLEISVNFKNNIGKMPWPVSGVIINYYGKQKHKAINGVEIINNGIDFSTDMGEKCRPVFPGKISTKFFIKGKGIAILINHGKYYTLYSGLENVSVESGQNVNINTILGTVITSKTNGVTELHFELWKGKETQNPVKWIKGAY